jgi:hypothetical protein
MSGQDKIDENRLLNELIKALAELARAVIGL